MKKIAIQMKQLQLEKQEGTPLQEDISESPSLALPIENDKVGETEKQHSQNSENPNNESQHTPPLPFNDIFRTELNFMA